MAEWWEELLNRPRFKPLRPVLKYGSIVLGLMGFLKTLWELPEIYHKDTALIIVICQFLWHVIRFALEVMALAACLMLPAAFCVGAAVGALDVVTFGIFKLGKRESAAGALAVILAVLAAGGFQYRYGFLGTFQLFAGTPGRVKTWLHDEIIKHQPHRPPPVTPLPMPRLTQPTPVPRLSLKLPKPTATPTKR